MGRDSAGVVRVKEPGHVPSEHIWIGRVEEKQRGRCGPYRKQASHRSGIAPALGLRAGKDCRPHYKADRSLRGDAQMSRSSWSERSRKRSPRRKAADPLRLEVLEDRSLLSFSSITSYAAGSQPQAVALGDFNNDTRLDLAVANNVGNSVSVLLANADGTFRPAVNA